MLGCGLYGPDDREVGHVDDGVVAINGVSKTVVLDVVRYYLCEQ
jgi:hypothetical protein